MLNKVDNSNFKIEEFEKKIYKYKKKSESLKQENELLIKQLNTLKEEIKLLKKEAEEKAVIVNKFIEVSKSKDKKKYEEILHEIKINFKILDSQNTSSNISVSSDKKSGFFGIFK